MFPFLIGRIRTNPIRDVHVKIKGFPFLIGRIRTEEELILPMTKMVFPFLIGRIRTCPHPTLQLWGRLVSIPHR